MPVSSSLSASLNEQGPCSKGNDNQQDRRRFREERVPARACCTGIGAARREIDAPVVPNTYLTGYTVRLGYVPKGFVVSIQKEELTFNPRRHDECHHQAFTERANVTGFSENLIGNPYKDGFQRRVLSMLRPMAFEGWFPRLESVDQSFFAVPHGLSRITRPKQVCSFFSILLARLNCWHGHSRDAGSGRVCPPGHRTGADRRRPPLPAVPASHAPGLEALHRWEMSLLELHPRIDNHLGEL